MKNIILKKPVNYNYVYDYTLIARFDEKKQEVYEYVVAWCYNTERDEWLSGNYFRNLEDAISFIRMKNNSIGTARLEQICGQALHYIHEELDLRDFEENYDLDFSEEELIYFGFADLI